MIISDLEFVGEVLEEERLALREPRYQHDPPGQALQAGSVRSSLSLGGRRELRTPWAPRVDSRELSLPSWKAWSARDPLQQRAMEQMSWESRLGAMHVSLEPLAVRAKYAASARAWLLSVSSKPSRKEALSTLKQGYLAFGLLMRFRRER